MNRNKQIATMQELTALPDNVIEELFTQFQLACYQSWIDQTDEQKRIEYWAKANAASDLLPFIRHKLKDMQADG